MGTVTLDQGIQERELNCGKSKLERSDAFVKPRIDEFEHIYRTYSLRVYCLCLRMTGNRDEAEDLTQETFLRMFQKLDTFRGESAFSAWVRRLAINVVLLRFQRASWRRETSLEELMDADPPDRYPPKRDFGAADPVLLGAIDRINLERAIDRLPQGFKTVLVLHDVEGYEHVDISRLTGCSIGTSKSQLHKARVKIREFLHETQWEEARQQRLAEGAKTSGDGAHVVLRFPRHLSQQFALPSSQAA